MLFKTTFHDLGALFVLISNIFLVAGRVNNRNTCGALYNNMLNMSTYGDNT